MKQAILIFQIFISGCLSLDHSASPSLDPREIMIVYTGNLLSELKPCGCAKEEDQGGIERRMQYIKDTRRIHPHLLLLDTGDQFKEPTRQGKLKAETLLIATEKMEYDAIALGDRDMVYGSKFLKDRPKIPWIAGNLIIDQFELTRSKVKSFSNGVIVCILAVADPTLFHDYV